MRLGSQKKKKKKNKTEQNKTLCRWTSSQLKIIASLYIKLQIFDFFCLIS